MKSKYIRAHKVVDPVVSVVVAGGVLAVVWRLGCIENNTAHLNVILFAAIASLFGTFLGFAITSLAILIGLLKAPEFGPLRRRKDYYSIFSDYVYAIVALACTVCCALVAAFISFLGMKNIVVLSAVLGFVIWSLLATGHALVILWSAVRLHADAERPL